MINMTAKDQVVEFNVGGLVFATTRRTLRKYPRNLLLSLHTEDMNESAMENGYVPEVDLVKDKHGNIFIDRDPELFRHVLNFLRNDKLEISQSFTDYHLLKHECAFYRLPEMVQAITSQECCDQVNMGGIQLQEEKFILCELFSGRNPRTKVVGMQEGHPFTEAVRAMVHDTTLSRTEKSYRIMHMGGILMGFTFWASTEKDRCIVEKWKIPLPGTAWGASSPPQPKPQRRSSVR